MNTKDYVLLIERDIFDYAPELDNLIEQGYKLKEAIYELANEYAWNDENNDNHDDRSIL